MDVESIRSSEPAGFNRLSHFRQNNFIFLYTSKHTLSLPCHHGYKIRSRQRIIIPFQPVRTTMMNQRVNCHSNPHIPFVLGKSHLTSLVLTSRNHSIHTGQQSFHSQKHSLKTNQCIQSNILCHKPISGRNHGFPLYNPSGAVGNS
jgi:hypothetical protein